MDLLIVVTGDPQEPELSELGTYDVWFARALEPYKPAITVWHAQRTAAPDRTVWDAIIITGSSASVHDRAAWSERCGAWCAARVREGVPTLGVCYGHQLLAHALGGETGPNPRGPHYGVSLMHTDDDPLFDGLQRPLPVYAIHSNAVTRLPPGARVIARSDRTEVEALCLAERCRTVQWHPEFVPSYIAARLHDAREQHDAVQPGFTDRSLASLRELPLARRVLHNFMRHFVGASVSVDL